MIYETLMTQDRLIKLGAYGRRNNAFSATSLSMLPNELSSTHKKGSSLFFKNNLLSNGMLQLQTILTINMPSFS